MQKKMLKTDEFEITLNTRQHYRAVNEKTSYINIIVYTARLFFQLFYQRQSNDATEKICVIKLRADT